MAINQEPHVHKNIICVNMFVKKDGKFLMLKRSDKKKFAPDIVHPIGGKLELGENPLEGAHRELMEEAGIKVKNVRLEAVLHEIAPAQENRTDWLNFHFSGEYDSGEIKETEEGELFWLSPEEIKEQKLFPSIKKVIENILDPNDGTVFASFKYNLEKDTITETRNIDSCVV